METKKYYGVKKDKEFPSYISEFFQAYPEKFEERKNLVKPAIYGLLAVVCLFIVIFPQVIPVLPLWFIRVVAVIGILFFGIGAWMASSDTYNVESDGKVKQVNIKKFIRNETDAEDEVGKEMYCILTAYDSSSNIVGLAAPVILKGHEYEDNAELIYHMCDDED